MEDKKRNIPIIKRISLGENQRYDRAVGNLSENFSSKLAIRLGELFQLEEFKRMNVDTFMVNIERLMIFLRKEIKEFQKKMMLMYQKKKL